MTDRIYPSPDGPPQARWKRETMVAVIRAYQAGRRAGKPHFEIDREVVRVFRELEPDTPPGPVAGPAEIIAWAARFHRVWFWRGCGQDVAED